MPVVLVKNGIVDIVDNRFATEQSQSLSEGGQIRKQLILHPDKIILPRATKQVEPLHIRRDNRRNRARAVIEQSVEVIVIEQRMHIEFNPRLTKIRNRLHESLACRGCTRVVFCEHQPAFDG